MVVVGHCDHQEEQATEEEEDGSVGQGAHLHQGDGCHCNHRKKDMGKKENKRKKKKDLTFDSLQGGTCIRF